MSAMVRAPFEQVPGGDQRDADYGCPALERRFGKQCYASGHQRESGRPDNQGFPTCQAARAAERVKANGKRKGEQQPVRALIVGEPAKRRQRNNEER